MMSTSKSRLSGILVVGLGLLVAGAASPVIGQAETAWPAAPGFQTEGARPGLKTGPSVRTTGPSVRTTGPSVQDAKRAFTPADWYRVKTLASAAMSPDGKVVAVQVTSVDETNNKRVNEIWVVPTDAGEPVRFTAPGVDSTNPRFSDDGSLLLFTSTRPGYAGNQWAIRMDRPGGEFPYRPASNEDAAGGRQGRGGGPGVGGGRGGSRPKDESFVVTTGIEGAPGAQGGRGQGARGNAAPGGRGRGDAPGQQPVGSPGTELEFAL